MKNPINTSTTLFNSLSSLSRAIPKFESDLISPFDFFLIYRGKNPKDIFWNRPLKSNLYLFALPNQLYFPSEDDYKIFFEKFTFEPKSELFYKNLLCFFKDLNKIDYCCYVEQINPGIIHWISPVNKEVKLFDLSLFGNYLNYVNDFYLKSVDKVYDSKLFCDSFLKLFVSKFK